MGNTLKKTSVKGYSITLEGINEVALAVNAVVPNRYVKQVILDALNDNIKPII